MSLRPSHVAPLPPRETAAQSGSPVPAQIERATDLLAVVNAVKGLTLDELERIAIEAAIDNAGGSLPSAARALGVSPSTLYRKRERWLGAT